MTQPNPGQGSGAEPSDAASLTIVVRSCAPGYDPFSSAADPARECSDPTDGVAFRLGGSDTTRPTSADATRATGADGPGAVVFAGLASGAYRLVERRPTGYAFAFVLGCTSNVRAFEGGPFFPLATVGADGTLGVTVLAGEDLACDWYDVPGEEPKRA